MRILLVEDDEKLKEALSFQLRKEGIETDSCTDGEEALYYIRQGIYDLILLDRMLPVLNGISVLSRMRKEGFQTPVILITALGALEDKIEGLDLGADDYLVKPFAHEELMARIRCIIRRPKQLALSDLLTRGDITYRLEEKMLTGPGGSCSLSKKEGNLLEAFLRNPGQILPRATLMVKGWGTEAEVEDSSLDSRGITYALEFRHGVRLPSGKAKRYTYRGTGRNYVPGGSSTAMPSRKSPMGASWRGPRSGYSWSWKTHLTCRRQTMLKINAILAAVTELVSQRFPQLTPYQNVVHKGFSRPSFLVSVTKQTMEDATRWAVERTAQVKVTFFEPVDDYHDSQISALAERLTLALELFSVAAIQVDDRALDVSSVSGDYFNDYAEVTFTLSWQDDRETGPVEGALAQYYDVTVDVNRRSD